MLSTRTLPKQLKLSLEKLFRIWYNINATVAEMADVDVSGRGG